MMRRQSLTVFMQQKLLQYGFPRLASLEPTHWMNATVLGCSRSVRRTRCPSVGPPELMSRSNSIDVMTFS